MCQFKQEFDKLHTNCSFNHSDTADKKQAAIEKVVQEPKSDLEKCIQTQRAILDQTTKDSQITLNTIRDEVIAERQMIDTQLQSYDKKTKSLEQMLKVVEAKQASLLKTLNDAATTKDDLNKLLNTLYSTKARLKVDLQAFKPQHLEAEFENIAKELDQAISVTTNHLKTISMQTEEHFKKKVEQHCKNREKSIQATKKDLENAIDDANRTIAALNKSALNSEDQQQAACLAVEIRLNSIVDSKDFGICIDKKAEDSLHRYLDKHPDKSQELMSTHFETTAGTSIALSTLIKNLAPREVDYYFQEDDHSYLRNLAERVAMGVVNNHLANNVPTMQEQQIQPPAPETSIHIDPTKQYIPSIQESPSHQLPPSFDTAKIKASGLLANTH